MKLHNIPFEYRKELDWDHYRQKYEDIHRMDRVLKAEGDTPDRYKVAKQADTLMTYYILSPEAVAHILKQLERGDLEIRIRIPELEQTNRDLNRIINRLIYSILLAAMTLALALLIPQLDLTWPWSLITWVILLGFVAMSFLVLRLIWSMWRSNRNKK